MVIASALRGIFDGVCVYFTFVLVSALQGHLPIGFLVGLLVAHIFVGIDIDCVPK